MIIKKGKQKGNAHPQQHPLYLAGEHMRRRAKFVIGEIERRRIQHNQPKHHQRDNRQHQGNIHAPHATRETLDRRNRHTIIYESSRTHSLNLSPRSAKSLNSSKLVPPGDNRTTSPASAISAALRTASCRPPARLIFDPFSRNPSLSTVFLIFSAASPNSTT